MSDISRRKALQRLGKIGIGSVLATSTVLSSSSLSRTRRNLEQRLQVDIRGRMTRKELQGLDEMASNVATLDNIALLTKPITMLTYRPHKDMFMINGERVEKDSLFDYDTARNTYRITGNVVIKEEKTAVNLYKKSTHNTLAHEIGHVHHLHHPQRTTLDNDWEDITTSLPVTATPTPNYTAWESGEFLNKDGFIRPYSAKGYHQNTNSFPTEDIATLFTDVYKELTQQHNHGVLPQDTRLIDKVSLLRDHSFISQQEFETVEPRYTT